jgi:hypothetical protein
VKETPHFKEKLGCYTQDKIKSATLQFAKAAKLNLTQKNSLLQYLGWFVGKQLPWISWKDLQQTIALPVK